MPAQHLFEYAVIRCVPRVEREEFVNIGVIMYCKSLKFLQTRYQLDHPKLMAFYDRIDCTELEHHLRSFEWISSGNKAGGPIALLELPLRFRWLTAWRSTIVQTSRVHPGLCTDANETLNKLFADLVL